MPSLARLTASLAIITMVAVAVPNASATPAVDACALLTPAQMSAVLGATVGPGTYISPTFKTTCTWTVPGGHEFVTLMLTSVSSFEQSKIPIVPAIVITPVSGIGDDAYYLTVGANAGLIVKKGNIAFKVAVYAANTSLDKKEALEKPLARQVVARL
ncbi:MAG TPA: hypothetical protein VFI20_06105 [Terracidiphilus sp.]|nr:hypothetical protein [Terracidiphilus sp.]